MTYFTSALPTTIEAMLELIARDLPGYCWSISKCHASCPHGNYVATLSCDEPKKPGAPMIVVLTDRGFAEQIASLEWGNHGATPFEALRNVYTQVTAGEEP